MKYVILIHSNPQPWAHPTQRYTDEGRALTEEGHQAMDRHFDEVWDPVWTSDEFVSAEALGDPASASLFRWTPDHHVASDGPYAETKEHLAGFFIIDVETRERAEELASAFAQPGGVVELRPVMSGEGDDQ